MSAALKKVVIVGGGYGGVRLAHLLRSTASVTLIDTKTYYELNIANTRNSVNGALLENPSAFIPHSKWAKKDVKIVVGKATGIGDNVVHVEGGDPVPFDFLVVATGATYPVFKASYGQSVENRKAELMAASARVKESKHVLIVGGGPTGIETAGEIRSAYPNIKVTLVSRGPIMRAYPEKVGKKLTQKLEKLGVEVIPNAPVENPAELAERVKEPTTITVGGKKIEGVDRVFASTGVGVFASEWIKSKYPDAINARGQVKVDKTFKVEGSDNVFAIGDVAASGDAETTAYNAGIHAAHWFKNFKLYLRAGNWSTAKPYKPQGPVAFLALGPNAGYTSLPLPAFIVKSMKSKDMLIGKSSGEAGV